MKNTIQFLFKILIVGILFVVVPSGWVWGAETLKKSSIPAFIATEFSIFIFAFGVFLTIVNLLFFRYFDKEINWRKHTKWEQYRFVLGLIAGIILNIVAIFLIHFIVVVGFEQHSLGHFISDKKLSIFVTTIILVAIRSFYFYKSIQENKVKEQKIIAGTASAKFESLKNQIDPHFLFNSLNVLSSLIEENPDKAQDFTTSLSKIYRYVLEQKNKELVPIEEELDFAKTYMKLLEMRFENSIVFTFPENSDFDNEKVIPLSLQLLLENCIKHNIVSEQKPLRIRIYPENGYLIVENNLQKKETLDPERKGVGLQNIVNRYAILTKRNVLIEESTNQFKVKIPILTKKLEIVETSSFNQENVYLKAKKRVKDIKEFYVNLASFCIVIPFLIFINLYTYSKVQWFWFPMLGWGMGLAFHGFEVFGYGKAWEERKIKELMDKEKKSEKWE